MAFDFGSGASGAMVGAQMGSGFGPIGTGAGAIFGGLTGGLFGGKKKKKKPKKLGTMDPMQQQLYAQYGDALQGQGPMAGMFNWDANQANQVFNQTTADPAYQQWQENAIPQITGQYRQNNLMNSSYSGEALARSGRDVQRNIDAQRASMQFQGQQGAQNRMQQGLNQVLGMSTFGYQKPAAETPGTIDQILGSLGPKAGDWLANYISK